MPFDRKTPELDAVAGKVVLEFVRHEHPERFEGFLKDTGKNEDEWERIRIRVGRLLGIDKFDRLPKLTEGIIEHNIRA